MFKGFISFTLCKLWIFLEMFTLYEYINTTQRKMKINYNRSSTFLHSLHYYRLETRPHEIFKAQVEP